MFTKKEKETVRTKAKNKLLSAQKYLDFAGAHDDTLILKNGGLRAILEISSVNFNLKSEEEQNAIIFAYQRFLNSLNFPVQILIKSRKLDIDKYLNGLKEKVKKQENQLLRQQMIEYIEYVGRLVEYADIMEKRFYVIIPQNPSRAEKKSMFASFVEKIYPDDTLDAVIRRKREFRELKQTLDERVNIVTTALENCGLNATKLNTTQIVQLFYQCYNPQHSRTQKLGNLEDYMIEGNPEDNLVAD